MAYLAHQFAGLRSPPLSSSPLSKPFSPKPKKATSFVPVLAASVISNAQTRDREKLKQVFEDAYERCRTTPLQGVGFNLEDFHAALDKYDFESEIGTMVR